MVLLEDSTSSSSLAACGVAQMRLRQTEGEGEGTEPLRRRNHSPRYRSLYRIDKCRQVLDYQTER